MSAIPVDIERLLTALGIEEWTRRGTKILARCPAPDHADSSPSWMIRDDPGERWHGSHVCKSCGLNGGPWELAAVVRGTSVEEGGRYVRSLFGGQEEKPRDLPTVNVVVRRRRTYVLPPGVVVPSSIEEWKRPALAYLERRGITHDQIGRWGLGFATIGPLAWRVVVPVVMRGHLVAYVARNIFEDGRPRYDMPTRLNGARPDIAIWGDPGFDSSRGAITVAEGVFSALALERAGAPNPCALLGSQLTVHKVTQLAKWSVVLVATDPDPAGDNVARMIERAIGRSCHVQRVELEESPDDSDVGALRRSLNESASGFANVSIG